MTVTEKHMKKNRKTRAKCLLLSVYKRIWTDLSTTSARM